MTACWRRGVPWNPDENRLAVRTEDHGLEFLDYEGESADPGYGTGRMTNWDRGTFEVHKWEDGKVVVTLDGSRVKGQYSLFSMRGSRDWLIHRMDGAADEDRKRVPTGVPPMLATPGSLPEDSDGWVYEPRWNGVRAMLTDDTGRVLLTGADRENLSVQFPEIRRIGRAIGQLEVILDGCIVPVDEGGTPRFDRYGIARRLRIGSDSGARNAAKTAPMVFMAFDLIWMEGRSLAGLPWEVRRRQLDDLRLDGPGWQTSPLLHADTAYSLGAGVVAKRRDSIYEIGTESTNWIDAANG